VLVTEGLVQALGAEADSDLRPFGTDTRRPVPPLIPKIRSWRPCGPPAGLLPPRLPLPGLRSRPSAATPPWPVPDRRRRSRRAGLRGHAARARTGRRRRRPLVADEEHAPPRRDRQVMEGVEPLTPAPETRQGWNDRARRLASTSSTNALRLARSFPHQRPRPRSPPPRTASRTTPRPDGDGRDHPPAAHRRPTPAGARGRARPPTRLSRPESAPARPPRRWLPRSARPGRRAFLTRADLKMRIIRSRSLGAPDQAVARHLLSSELGSISAAGRNPA
jgi:hypothetical protein